MNIFNIFNPKWSGAQMTEVDRQMLFYCLQRRTSLTAWQREAKWFDKFVAVLEKQVREEPIHKNARTPLYDTPWEGKYREALRAQVHYEKALQKLARGDRTVWRWNEQGHFADAVILTSALHSEIVNHGPHGDKFPEGKYLDEMVDVLIEYDHVCTEQADVIQPQIADTAAPYYWTPYMREELLDLPLPNPLPPVPASSSTRLYRTGEIIPTFGIYEPQVEDGCMNYLLGGVEAPGIRREANGRTSGPHAVHWRLTWEDTRYLDRKIPEIEQHYFPVEPVIEHVEREEIRSEIIVHADTNTFCPLDGAWVALDNLTARIDMKAGELMPPCEGRSITWVWVKKN